MAQFDPDWWLSLIRNKWLSLVRNIHTTYFINAIQHTDKKMLESIMLQNASTLDHRNNSISDDIKLDIPIFQLIGSKDEIWETNIAQYNNRLTKIKNYIIEGEMHKGVILNASLFYEGLKKIYSCN